VIGHISAAWMTSFHNVALLLQADSTGNSCTATTAAILIVVAAGHDIIIGHSPSNINVILLLLPLLINAALL